MSRVARGVIINIEVSILSDEAMRVYRLVERYVCACVRDFAHDVLHGDGREARVVFGGDVRVV